MNENQLEIIIRQAMRKGGTVSNRTETTATIIEPKQFDPLGCILLGFLPYVLWYGLVKRDKSWYIELLDDGTVLWNGQTEAEIKRKRMIENIVFGVAVWLVFSLCCCSVLYLMGMDLGSP